MKRKGQAAIEYLSTYGWALMVLGVALGALYLFLDFKPDLVIPEKCDIGDSFNCKDFKINGTSKIVTLSLNNAVGEEIELDSLICHYGGQDYRTTAYGITIAPGANFFMNCSMVNASLKSKSKIDFTIVYFKRGMSFPSSSDGFLTGSLLK